MEPIFLGKTDKPPLHTKEQMTKDIEAQIKAFFAKGGKIVELPPGHSEDFTQPFRIAPKRES